MRRVPIALLKPGMKLGHTLYNSGGQMLINHGVTLNNHYIDSLKKLGITAIYIIDDFYPEFYVQDVIDDNTRIGAIKLTKKILQGSSSSKSPLDKALMSEARSTIGCIIEQLVENPSLMVNLIDIRSIDDYLFAHSVNVCVLSLITGVSMGFSKPKLYNLGIGALLHDIGKTLIPPVILNKPGSLSTDEYTVIKRHPEYGYTILTSEESSIKKSAAIIALQHHERYNGEGYPKGIQSGSINELSQIVGIADVYDAMTADRVYRKAHPPHEAYEMLAGSGDFYFDYDIVRAFLSNVAAYPVGSVVRLSSNETALVVDTPKGYSLYPRIKILYDAEGNRLNEPVDVDLSEQSSLIIVKVLDHNEVEDLKKQDLSRTATF